MPRRGGGVDRPAEGSGPRRPCRCDGVGRRARHDKAAGLRVGGRNAAIGWGVVARAWGGAGSRVGAGAGMFAIRVRRLCSGGGGVRAGGTDVAAGRRRGGGNGTADRRGIRLKSGANSRFFLADWNGAGRCYTVMARLVRAMTSDVGAKIPFSLKMLYPSRPTAPAISSICRAMRASDSVSAPSGRGGRSVWPLASSRRELPIQSRQMRRDSGGRLFAVAGS